jgi:glutaredoxin
MNTKVFIYSRVNCHLCEEAEKNAREVLVEIPFDLEVIYIDGNQELERLYGEEVPVTLINGAKHDYFKVDKKRFSEAILRQRQ